MSMGLFGELAYLRPEADFVLKAEMPASRHRTNKLAVASVAQDRD